MKKKGYEPRLNSRIKGVLPEGEDCRDLLVGKEMNDRIKYWTDKLTWISKKGDLCRMFIEKGLKEYDNIEKNGGSVKLGVMGILRDEKEDTNKLLKEILNEMKEGKHRKGKH